MTGRLGSHVSAGISIKFQCSCRVDTLDSQCFVDSNSASRRNQFLEMVSLRRPGGLEPLSACFSLAGAGTADVHYPSRELSQVGAKWLSVGLVWVEPHADTVLQDLCDFCRMIVLEEHLFRLPLRQSLTHVAQTYPELIVLLRRSEC